MSFFKSQSWFGGSCVFLLLCKREIIFKFTNIFTNTVNVQIPNWFGIQTLRLRLDARHSEFGHKTKIRMHNSLVRTKKYSIAITKCVLDRVQIKMSIKLSEFQTSWCSDFGIIRVLAVRILVIHFKCFFYQHKLRFFTLFFSLIRHKQICIKLNKRIWCESKVKECSSFLNGQFYQEPVEKLKRYFAAVFSQQNGYICTLLFYFCH